MPRPSPQGLGVSPAAWFLGSVGSEPDLLSLASSQSSSNALICRPLLRVRFYIFPAISEDLGRRKHLDVTASGGQAATPQG